jgi:peptide deformylase
MAVLPICITGEPVLHEVAESVTQFGPELDALIADMFETMDLAPGVGLAAPQIGVGLRVFVWSYAEQDEAPNRGVAINPELWLSPIMPGEPDELEDVEGCLSFPGERFPVRRAERVLLRAVDASNEPYEYELSGWFARIMQHEFDHLNGLLYVDRLVSPFDKMAAKATKKNAWGEPGLSWMPGIDHPEG